MQITLVPAVLQAQSLVIAELDNKFVQTAPFGSGASVLDGVGRHEFSAKTMFISLGND